MTLGLFLGCLLGGAVCLLLYALVPPRPAVGSVVYKYERSRSRQVAADRIAEQQIKSRAGRLLGGWLAQRGVKFERLRQNLELADIGIERHLVNKIKYAVIGFAIPVVYAGLAALAGSGVMPAFPLGIGVVLAAALFWVPDLEVVRIAKGRRDELRRALACYLDLVSMSLAGGRGIPEALPTSARIGDGWAFALLQSTLSHARRVGDTPWAAFSDLGKRTGMQELQDLGGALLLVADDGAKVRSSLAQRAQTLRRRQLAESEGAADKADDSIRYAQIVMAAGFLLFMMYPAVVAVIGI